MDLSSIKAATNEVVIRHPATQEPIGLTVQLLPPSDDKVKAVKRRVTNENLRSRGKALTAEKLEAHAIDALVAAIAGWTWSGEANWSGEKLEFNPVNVRRVLKEAPWIKEQIDDAFGDDAGFFQN